MPDPSVTDYASLGANTPATTTASTTGTGTTDTSLWDIAKGVMGSGTAKGAALGALFTNLLSQSGAGSGVVTPMDMSKNIIYGRDTVVGSPNFVPYSEYGARDSITIPSEINAATFGAPSGLGSLMDVSKYTAKPTMASRAAKTYSSVGSGRNLMPTINVTPRSNKEISPLTGALLGGAMGYMMTPETASSKSLADAIADYGSGSLTNLFDLGVYGFDKLSNYLSDFFKNSGSSSSTNDPYTFIPGYDENLNEPGTGIFSGGTSGTSSSNSSYSPSFSGGSLYGGYYKDGGMATPLMADGGMAEPSFYTYGTIVDPMQILGVAQNTGMAGGGMARGGLHVPTVDGRHDYRAGSRVMGEGDGQSDDIPAMLADGEYVIDAETVAQLGNGSSKAGSDMLDKFREEIRSHKRSAPINKIPPASKSPLQYLKQAQSRSKKNG